jgi:peptidyl-prolyl cis-trans isomerase A (cyclophilin A)
MKFWKPPCFAICIALTLAGCNGGSSASLSSANQSPVVTGLTAQVVSGNAVTLTAIATDDVGVTGYCFKTVNTAPLASDPCFQNSAQKNGAALLPGVTYYVWAKDAADNVSASFKGPCSIAGYAASDMSSKNTICMLTDKGEMVLELDAAKAPVTVANFLQYVNDGFYSGTTFHRVILASLIQGGGYTYTSATSYQLKTSTYAPIALERTSATGLSNLRGTIAMARSPSAADSATNQFFINVADNNFLDAALQADGNGYAVFGNVISGLNVANLIKAVPFETGGAGTNQPITPIFIQWAYQLK